MDGASKKNVLRRQRRHYLGECTCHHQNVHTHHHHHHPASYEDHFRIASHYRNRDWYPPRYVTNNRVPSGYVVCPRVPIGYYFNENDIIHTTSKTCPFDHPRPKHRPDNINDTPPQMITKSKSKSTKHILDNCEIISGYIVSAYASDGRSPREFVTTQDCSDIGSQISVDIINATGGVIDASKKLSAYMMPLTPEDVANDVNPLVLVAHADEVAITLDRNKIMYSFNHDPDTEGDLLPSVENLKKKIDEFREKKHMEKLRGVKVDSGMKMERKIDTRIPISFMTSDNAPIEDELMTKFVDDTDVNIEKCVDKEETLSDSPRTRYDNSFSDEDSSVGSSEKDFKRSLSSRRTEELIVGEGNTDVHSSDDSMMTNYDLTDDESSVTLESEIERLLLDNSNMERVPDYDIDSSSDDEDSNKTLLKPDFDTLESKIPKEYKEAVPNKILTPDIDTDDSLIGMIPGTTKLRNNYRMRGPDTRLLKPDVDKSRSKILKDYKDAVSNKIPTPDITDDSLIEMIPETTKLRNVSRMRGPVTGLLEADVDSSGLNILIKLTLEEDHFTGCYLDVDTASTGMNPRSTHLKGMIYFGGNTRGNQEKDVYTSRRFSELDQGSTISKKVTPGDLRLTGIQKEDVYTSRRFSELDQGSTISKKVTPGDLRLTGIQKEDMYTARRSSELDQGSTISRNVTPGNMITTELLEEVDSNEIKLNDMAAISSSPGKLISYNIGDFDWTMKNAFESDCVPRDRFSLRSLTSQQSTGANTVDSSCFDDSTSFVSKGAIPKTSGKKGKRRNSRRKSRASYKDDVESRSNTDSLSSLKEDVRKQTEIVEKLMKEEEKQTKKLKYLLKKEQEENDRQRDPELEMEATRLLTQYFQNPSPLSGKIHDFCKENFDLFKDTLDDVINMSMNDPETVRQLHEKLNKVITDDLCKKLEGLTFNAPPEEDTEEEQTSSPLKQLPCERMEELPKEFYTLVEVRLEEPGYYWVTKLSTLALQHDIIDSCRQYYVQGLEECDITEGNFCLVGMGDNWVRGQIKKDYPPPKTEVFLIDICMGGKVSGNMSIKAIPQALTLMPSLGIRIKMDPGSQANYGRVRAGEQIYIKPVGVVTGYNEDHVVVEVMSMVIHDLQDRYDQCQFEIPAARVAALTKKSREDRVRTDNIKKKKGGKKQKTTRKTRS